MIFTASDFLKWLRISHQETRKQMADRLKVSTYMIKPGGGADQNRQSVCREGDRGLSADRAAGGTFAEAYTSPGRGADPKGEDHCGQPRCRLRKECK